MWNVIGFRADGTQYEPALRHVERPFSIPLVLALARSLRESGRVNQFEWPMHLLEREAAGQERGVPGRDAISLWNTRVADQPLRISDSLGHRSLRWDAVDDGLALDNEDGPNARQRTRFAMRHDATTLVVGLEPRTTALWFRYSPEDPGLRQWLETTNRLGAHGVWLESRSYLGRTSVTELGLCRSAPRMPSFKEHFLVRTGEHSGVLAATILRAAGQWAERLNEDPMFNVRLDHSEREHHSARAWPKLVKDCLPTKGEVWVLVHGTLSCCYGAFEGLPTSFFSDRQVFRFEHDTCAEIEDNVETLLKILKDAPPEVGICLVAHSRGGIVARQAGARLNDRGVKVRVLTFGTPHKGTPLVMQVKGLLPRLKGAGRWLFTLPQGGRLFRFFAPAAGQEVMSLLARLGIANQFGLSNANAVLAANAYALVRAGDLPAGIYEMRENSSYLKGLEEPWTGCASWGGKFDVESDPDGFGIAFEQGLSREMFAHRENDLIVPTDSALAFGDPTTVPGCAHTAYFARADIQNALR